MTTTTTMMKTTPFGRARMSNDIIPPFFTIIPSYPFPSPKPQPLSHPTLSFPPISAPSRTNRFLSCRFSGSDPTTPPPDAVGALADLLYRDYGVTQEEALGIVSRAPGYVAMVVDAVRELDEVPSSFWEGASFEEKVAWMARRRNDGGKVAFFESLGMSSTSALNVSRYLSSHSLPYLLRKVGVNFARLFSLHLSFLPAI